MKNKINIKKFTLIELIIVIVVIGILAGMALPKFIGITKDAKVAAMDQDLDTLEKAVQLYTFNNDGSYPFIKDGSGNYTKISVTSQTLKDALHAIGDDQSQVYTLDMDLLEPYIQQLKHTNPISDTYLYSTKTGVAINEQGKISSNGVTYHILNGISSDNSSAKSPVVLSNLVIGTSFDTTGVITSSHILYNWGQNDCGQIGDKSTTNAITPTKITLPSGISPVQISEGYQFSLALSDNGELYSWGDNRYGQLGIGSTTNTLTPTKVIFPNGVKPTQISAGGYHAMAIGSDGNLYTWGKNGNGEIGDGTYTDAKNGVHDKLVPTKITFPNGVKPVKIDAGENYSLAICDDKNLYSWGDNHYGKLGNTIYSVPVLIPTPVSFPNNVKTTQIVAGVNHTAAICDDGELYTWGRNYHGQLGIGSKDSNSHPTPIKVALSNGVKPVQVAIGNEHTMIIGNDGELYTFGYNNWGQLGIGVQDFNSHTNPEKITLASGVKPVKIVAGYVHSIAIGDDGELYTWGANGYGELGNNSTTSVYSPTKINIPN